MAIYVAMGAPSPAQAVAKELAAGSEAIAEAVTAKGVPTSAFDSLQKMADNIRDIQQETTVIDGGDMYANQLFGDGTLWNLYEVLAQMKSQFMGAGQYAALIVCEYYKGYDSLQLQGADAYYTCDGDFYDYASPNHVWHDSDNGKANRWVCFLYTNSGSRLDITNTAISPRSIYIGGHIGTIEYFVNGRLTDFVCGVEETDVVDNFMQKNYTQAFGRILTIRNVKSISDLAGTSVDYLAISGLTGTINKSSGSMFPCNSFVAVDAENAVLSIGSNTGVVTKNSVIGIEIKGVHTVTSPDNTTGSYKGIFVSYGSAANIQYIHIDDLVEILNSVSFISLYAGSCPDLIDISVGAFEMNLNIANWNPTNVLADPDKTAQLIDNIKNHILARVSDATGGTQLVFTVSTNMYNAIASETITWQDQTMTLADAFLTKNWLLAGA